MKKFYNNIEVEVIAELPNGQVAISFITGLHHEHDPEYGDNCEPIETTLVVDKSQLRDSAITKEDIILERDNMLKDIAKKRSEMISNANSQIRQEHSELQKEIKEMKALRDSLLKGSKQVETMKKLKEGKINYVVYQSNIQTYSDFVDKVKTKLCEEANQIQYESLMFRIHDNELIIDTWSKAQLFETLEEAKEYLSEHFSKMKLDRNFYIGYLDEIMKWDLKVEGLTLDLKNEIIKKHNEEILKSIESLKRSVNDYESKLRMELTE